MPHGHAFNDYYDVSYQLINKEQGLETWQASLYRRDTGEQVATGFMGTGSNLNSAQQTALMNASKGFDVYSEPVEWGLRPRE